MRRFLLAAGLLAAMAAGPAIPWPASAGPLVTVSGPTPFPPGCDPMQDGTVFLNTEVEPWVAAHPVDPSRLVGGWQQDRWSNGGARGLLAAASFDGGTSWQRSVVPKITVCSGGTVANGGDFNRASDPWVTIAPNGDVYFMSLVTSIENPPNREGGLGKSGMMVNKSEDGGLTWGDPITLARDDNPRILHDKNSITADPNDSNFVYAVWDKLSVPLGSVINPENVIGLGFQSPAVLSRTTDGGQTWSAPRIIYQPGANNQTIGNQIVVLPTSRGGVLVNVFNEILNFKGNDDRAKFDFNVTVIRSTDKGERWSRPIRVADMLTRALFDGFGVRDPDTNFPLRTGDIIPEIAVDRSSGNIFIVWQDARFDGDFQHDSVALSMSTDGGLTWTAPMKVNRTPFQAGQRGAAHTPAVYVASDGVVGVSYHDFRNDTPEPGGAGPLSTDAFLARYVVQDGQLVFIPDFGLSSTSEGDTRLTDESFDTRRAPVARGFFLGDYAGLTASANVFVPFFTITTPTDRADVVATRVSP